jgi:uncharacterized protein (TIGR03067 family)
MDRTALTSASLLLLAVLRLPAPTLGADPERQPTVVERLDGLWDEAKLDKEGKIVPGADADTTWDFDRDLVVETDWASEAQQQQYTPHLNTRADPIWLDLWNHREKRVMLGIIKFDGDRLSWVEGETVEGKAWKKAKGDLPGRPKSFTPAKGSRWVLHILVKRKPKPAKGQERAQAKHVFGYWIEVRHEEGDVVKTNELDLLGWELRPTRSGCWERRGESVYVGLGEARLRPEKRPWWLDLEGTGPKGKPRIWPGIAKFEKGRLIWVRSPHWLPLPPPGKDCPERPRSFEATKQNGYEKVILVPTDGRYAQD